MPDYSNSSIYKLCHRNPFVNATYVGSTTNMAKRKYSHKQCINKEHTKDRYLYSTIKNTGGWENWEMVELEKYSATDKKDLHRKEREWKEKLGATLNMRTPILSEEESLEQHREAARRWKKENPEKNRAAVKKWKKQNPEVYKSYQAMMMVCPCGAVVTRNHLSRHRKSRVHKDWIEQNEVPDLEIYKNCFVVCE